MLGLGRALWLDYDRKDTSSPIHMKACNMPHYLYSTSLLALASPTVGPNVAGPINIVSLEDSHLSVQMPVTASALLLTPFPHHAVGKGCKVLRSYTLVYSVTGSGFHSSVWHSAAVVYSTLAMLDSHFYILPLRHNHIQRRLLVLQR